MATQPLPVTYTLIDHKGEKRIALHFTRNREMNERLRKNPNARWSRTLQCWHIPDTADNRRKCGIEAGLEAKKSAEANNKPVKVIKGIETGSNKKLNSPGYIKGTNNEAMTLFLQMLQLKAYSKSTITTYKNEFGIFLRALGKVPAESLPVSRIKDYLQYCFTELKLSENTIHSRINALKFYYEQVLGREKFFWEIPRPKKHDKLPKVLSEKEVSALFNAVSNIKHKSILFTAYSAGLRVSEVVNLKIRDVDSSRMQLFIEKSKGKKDRYVGMGILLLDILRAYIESCRPRPRIYLFENPDNPGQPYSIRSVQQIFHNAKAKAHILKEVGIHSLRHSFATHLLEKGIDIRYIKDLLGHLNIHTTERYLHVKREALINIPNLLDELNKSGTLDVFTQPNN